MQPPLTNNNTFSTNNTGPGISIVTLVPVQPPLIILYHFLTLLEVPTSYCNEGEKIKNPGAIFDSTIC